MEIMEYSGTPEQFTEWVKRNVYSIIKQCGWAEISAVTKDALVLSNNERPVLNLTIMHTNGVKTYLMCEVANDGMPFSACLEASIAIKAIRTCERCDGRIVVVSPIINDNIIESARAKNLPVNFLILNQSQCKYWSCAK